MNGQKIILSILSILISISLALSAYTFNAMEKRIAIVETKIDNRIERIAILEQQSKENSSAHFRIETKVDTLLEINLLRK
jgi:hypothetical protein